MIVNTNTPNIRALPRTSPGSAEAFLSKGSASGSYRSKRRAMTIMRTGSRLSGKYVPSFAELERAWPEGNACPRCKVKFEFVRRTGAAYGSHPSIQHFLPSESDQNPLAMICGKCNHALINLGDTVDAMSVELGLRKCTCCGNLKQEGDFYPKKMRKSGNTGLQSHCKDCQKDRLRQHTNARRVGGAQ